MVTAIGQGPWSWAVLLIADKDALVIECTECSLVLLDSVDFVQLCSNTTLCDSSCCCHLLVKLYSGRIVFIHLCDGTSPVFIDKIGVRESSRCRSPNALYSVTFIQ